MTSPLLTVHFPGAYQFCNFRCSYCYLPGFQDQVSADVVDRHLAVVDRMDAFARPLHVLFGTDGELSVAKPMWPVLQRIDRLPSTRLISIFTNATGNVSAVLDLVGPGRLSVMATCHIQQLDASNGWSRFERAVEVLQARARHLVVSVLLDPAVLDRAEPAIAMFRARGHEVFAYPLYQTTGTYTAEQMRVVTALMVQTNPAPIVNAFQLHLRIRGLQCATGREYVELELDGSVVDCWRHRRPLGNLFEGDVRLNEDDVVCPSGGCSSNWPVGFSAPVRRMFDRVDSLYGFRPKNLGSGAHFRLSV